MDFLDGLVVYLTVGGIIAYFGKTHKGERLWEKKRNRTSYVCIVAVIWPMVLLITGSAWLLGAYEEEK